MRWWKHFHHQLYLQINADLIGKRRDTGGNGLLLSWHQEVSVSGIASKAHADQLKDGREEWELVNGTNNPIGEIEGQEGREAKEDNGWLLIGGFPLGGEIVSDLSGLDCDCVHEVIALGLHGSLVLFLAEGTDGEGGARENCREGWRWDWIGRVWVSKGRDWTAL